MPRQYTPRVSLTCPQCGIPFTVIACRASTAKYCSESCYAASGTRRYKGKHGHARTYHRSAEYRTWHGIKNRCLNPAADQYANYGGRGITVCDAWRDSFEAFLSDVGGRPSPAHSIDRIDVDGNYEPGNVRWSTSKEQGNNRRTNRLVTYNGETKPLGVWATVVGLSKHALLARLNAGWDIERAMTTPARRW